MRRNPRHRTALFALGLAAAASAASAATLRVGAASDPACDASTISAALLGAVLNGEDDVIRIARNQTYVNQYLHLTSFPDVLELAGGYDTCADESPSDHTAIAGRADQPVIEIDGGTASDIRVRRLDLRRFAGVTEVIRVEEAGRLTTFDSIVREGNASGLRVLGAEAEATLRTTQITGNSAVEGGGIYCDGGTVALATEVTDNTATTDGGGIRATGGCRIVLEDGAWVVDNEAQVGGGLYVDGGARVDGQGSASAGRGRRPRVPGGSEGPEGVSDFSVLVGYNNADYGGGIFAGGAGTEVDLVNCWVASNIATVRAGGLYAADFARVQMRRTAGDCVVPGACSLLNLNRVEETDGAAGVADDGGFLQLIDTAVNYNEVVEASPYGSVLFTSGAGSGIKTEGVVLHGNRGADTVFEGRQGAQTSVAFTTAGGNSHFVEGTPVEARTLYLVGGADASIVSSVLWPTSGYQVAIASGSQLGPVDCLITQTAAGLPAGSTRVTVGDPLYRDLAGHDLQPGPGSPMVDACDDAVYEPQFPDLLFRPRGHDHPTESNPPGVLYDLGAWEQWELFADGFETGDTTRWSLSVP
jgi:predicted outer membrane repeat protein